MSSFFFSSLGVMSISSGSELARLKLRMALPGPPPISGSYLEPKISTTITRIKSNSCMPIPYIKASVFIGQRYTDGSRAGQAKGVASFCPSGYTTKCRGGMEALTRPEGPKSAQVRITGINGKHSTPVRFRGQDCKAAARELLQRMYHAKRIG